MYAEDAVTGYKRAYYCLNSRPIGSCLTQLQCHRGVVIRDSGIADVNFREGLDNIEILRACFFTGDGRLPSSSGPSRI